MLRTLCLAGIMITTSACATMDVPQAHRGRLFDRTGSLAFYAGGEGFVGPVLPPGTYYTGLYDEIMMVDCSTITEHDPITVLTKDGVQFGIDIYVRFSANCTDEAVIDLMTKLSPDPDADHTITTTKLYATYVRPAINGVVREVISPHRASEINEAHQQILANIRRRFIEEIKSHEGNVIVVYEVSLSNLDFPVAMDQANEQRAVQSILRDKAIAERERVKAEIATSIVRKELEQREGEAEAARIDVVGAALKRNPEFLRYDMQSKMPDIYRDAGAKGNMVIAAPTPSVVLRPDAKGQ